MVFYEAFTSYTCYFRGDTYIAPGPNHRPSMLVRKRPHSSSSHLCRPSPDARTSTSSYPTCRRTHACPSLSTMSGSSAGVPLFFHRSSHGSHQSFARGISRQVLRQRGTRSSIEHCGSKAGETKRLEG